MEQHAEDGTGLVWRRPADLVSGDVQVFAGHEDVVAQVSPRKRFVLVAYADGRVRRWPLGTQVTTQPRHFGGSV